MSEPLGGDPRQMPGGFALERLRGSIEQQLFGGGPVRLDRYVVLEQLGRGGMGVVYRAFDPRLERVVAVKVTHVRRDSEAGARLLREAKLLGRINHPNVLTVHDVGVADAQVFVATEYVEGGTLDRWWVEHPVTARGRFERLLELARQAALGLTVAHAKGLIHRDVKPSNLIVGADGRLRVADFGLARETARGVPSERSADAVQEGDVSLSAEPAPTRTGVIMGTPAYMAPEQRGGAPDERSDQFSWAASFYEASLGVRPEVDDEGAVQLPDPHPGHRVPRWWRVLLARCLRADPAERFEDMAAVVEAIERARARRRRNLVLGVAGLVTGASLLALKPWASDGEEPVSCERDPEAMRGVWGVQQEAAVRAALMGPGASGSVEVVEPILRALDRRAEAWEAERLDACEATHVRREQSSALMDARVRCLERRRRELRATVERLAAAEPSYVERALDAVESLPAAERCADPSHAFARGSAPDDDAGPPPTGSICGTADWQDVERYDGTLGPSPEFVALHQRPVVEIRWRSDLGRRHAKSGAMAGAPICTGTLVARDLVLTAGHCIDPAEHGPRDADGEPLGSDQIAKELEVVFNHQVYSDGQPGRAITREVEGVLEHRRGGIDYAVLRVRWSPGVRWQPARLAAHLPPPGSPLTIIQHVDARPKVVDGGQLDRIQPGVGRWDRVMTYDDIDTEVGSSGAAVLGPDGAVVGIHVGGECGAALGFNVAEPIDEILAVSDVLDDLVDGDVPLVGDIDGGADELVLWRPPTRQWLALHADGTPVFPRGREPIWGRPGDVPLLGDLDGDGLDEMIVWSRASGRWSALRADGSTVFALGAEPAWGDPDGVPMLGDLDGDGADEMVVRSPHDMKWYALRADGTPLFPPGEEPLWGQITDYPLLGDLDGDGADELVVWRTSHYRWYALRVDGTRVFPRGSEPVFGRDDDVPLVADVDGDGRDDLVLWRSDWTQWYAMRADHTRLFPFREEPRFGQPDDVPLLGDFDGEGGAELSLWRPSSARWIARSAGGEVIVDGVKWGRPYVDPEGSIEPR